MKRNHRFFYILAGLVLFLLAAGSSYLFLGRPTPAGTVVWQRLARVLPLPIASVDGLDIRYADLRAASLLGAPDPLDFSIRQKAIAKIAQGRGLGVAESDMVERREALLLAWQLDYAAYQKKLRQSGVSVGDFENLFFKADILRDRLILQLNNPGAKVAQVRDKLEAGGDFAAVAIFYSDDAVSAPLGGDIGFVRASEMSSELRQAVKVLKDGEWVGPVNTPQGYIFAQLVEKQRPAGSNPERLHLRIILIKTFDFENWLDGQIEQMYIKVYI